MRPPVKIKAKMSENRLTVVKQVLIIPGLSFSSGRKRIIPTLNPNSENIDNSLPAEIVAAARPTLLTANKRAASNQKKNPKIAFNTAVAIRNMEFW